MLVSSRNSAKNARSISFERARPQLAPQDAQWNKTGFERARLQPCRKMPNKTGALAPEGRGCTLRICLL
jgi:hypothetical protein